MTEVSKKGNPLTRGERLQVMIDDDELTAVDDFRFSHRIPSRSEAVRELLRRGLTAAGHKTSQDGSESSGTQSGGRD